MPVGDRPRIALVGLGMAIKPHAEADGSAGGTGADPMDFPNDYLRAAVADFLDAVETGRAPFANPCSASVIAAASLPVAARPAAICSSRGSRSA